MSGSTRRSTAKPDWVVSDQTTAFGSQVASSRVYLNDLRPTLRLKLRPIIHLFVIEYMNIIQQISASGVGNKIDGSSCHQSFGHSRGLTRARVSRTAMNARVESHAVGAGMAYRRCGICLCPWGSRPTAFILPRRLRNSLLITYCPPAVDEFKSKSPAYGS